MAEQARRPSRRWLYVAAAGAALAFLVYAVVWRAAAAEMNAAVGDWIEEQRAAGLEVSYGAVRTGGFPFFLRVRIEAPEIAAPGAWRWRGEALRLNALPYNFNRLDFMPRGEQILWVAGRGEWRARADNLSFAVAGDKTRGWLFMLTVAGASASRDSDGARAALGALDLALSPDAADSSTLSLKLSVADWNAAVPGGAFTFDTLQSELVLSQPQWLIPPDPATQWRAAGGALAINKFNAEIEGARLSANGTIRLDDDLQPAGLLHAELVNPAGLAPLLAQAGALTPKEAESATAGLTLMAIAGGGRIVAPIELQDGAASIGGVKLADLPPVN